MSSLTCYKLTQMQFFLVDFEYANSINSLFYNQVSKLINIRQKYKSIWVIFYAFKILRIFI